jgi:hypothetical protein
MAFPSNTTSSDERLSTFSMTAQALGAVAAVYVMRFLCKANTDATESPPQKG